MSGSIVVGTAHADSTGQRYHAFVYDLGAAAPRMRDLGRLTGGDGDSPASAVDGTTVVGQSWAGRRDDPFAYTLDGPASGMRDLGTLGGSQGGASDVSAKIVVGIAARAGDGQWQLAAYDLGAVSPQLSDLGELSPLVEPTISGNVVVGAMVPSGEHSHAAAWTLSRTTKAALQFDRFNSSMRENAGRVRVTVTRAGDPGPAVTVPYATRGVDARAGKDFTATSGTLSFAAGQTSSTFTVPIRNDAVTEGPETIMVTLGRPTGGAIRGTPNVAGLIIRASDQRPDALISTRSMRGYVGNNIYNTTGARQARTLTAHRARTRTFYVLVYNDGNVTNTITLHGSPPRAASVVRYYRGSSNITTAMRSTAGLRFRIGSHSHRRIRMTIKAAATARIGAAPPSNIKASWTGDCTCTDLVKGVVRVIGCPLPPAAGPTTTTERPSTR